MEPNAVISVNHLLFGQFLVQEVVDVEAIRANLDKLDQVLLVEQVVFLEFDGAGCWVPAVSRQYAVFKQNPADPALVLVNPFQQKIGNLVRLSRLSSVIKNTNESANK